MAFDVSGLDDYSWADIAKAAKHAMLANALGGNTLTINGRSMGRISIEDAKSLYEYATAQTDAENDQFGDGVALVEFGRPV